jgi:hypothetical protein
LDCDRVKSHFFKKAAVKGKNQVVPEEENVTEEFKLFVQTVVLNQEVFHHQTRYRESVLQDLAENLLG